MTLAESDGPTMDGTRRAVEKLEAQIEALQNTAEWCRKIMSFSKAAVAVGLLILASLVLGLLRTEPAVLIGAIAAAIGGTVAFGSNRSTLERTMSAIAAAEAARRQLIGTIPLRVVDP